VVAEFDGVYSTHLRDEGSNLLEAIDEAIKIGLATSVKVQISHLKISDISSWGKLDEVFKKIELALKDGVKISCDRYPYTASSTNLESILPDFALAGGREAEIERLKNRHSRKRIKRTLMHTYSKNFWKRVMILSVKYERNKWMEGRKIFEIARIKSKHPCEVVLDLLLEEEAQVSAIFFTMDERNLRRILSKPYTMIGSDSASRPTHGVLASERIHPRGFGTFPRVLRKYVVEEGIFGIEEAIYKMTYQPMSLLGVEDRGVVEEGKYADLIIFDEGTICDRATYQFPYRYPTGVKYVIINGTLVVDDGVYTGELAGKVLRKSHKFI
jgi:N-acyl-D-amino-acid deacylase